MEKFLAPQASVSKINKEHLVSYEMLQHFPVDHCSSPLRLLGAPNIPAMSVLPIQWEENGTNIIISFLIF